LDDIVTDREEGDVAIEVADFVLSFFKRKRLIYRPYVSTNVATIPGGFVYRSIGDLIDKSGDLIGTIRLEVYIPFDSELPIRIRIEWQRDAFGFWYREDVYIYAIEELDISILNRSARMIETTADGSVRLSSANLGRKKVKNNKIKDLTFSNAMKLWQPWLPR
jgi:hypothetical protein